MDRLQCAENIAAVLGDLGLSAAHFAVRLDTDWTRYVTMHSPSIASMTLVSPATGFDVEAVRPLGKRLLVITDDQPSGRLCHVILAGRAAFSILG